MVRESISFWNSIVTKFALFFTALLVLSILVSGYLVFRKASLRIKESARVELEHTTELGYKAFSAVLEEVSNDISFLTDLPAMTAFAEEPNEENRASLARVYKSLLENKDNYFQIRLIGVANSGREIIRFDKSDGRVFEIPGDQLQQKGDRDYFVETISMTGGGIYFSEINLNQEFGEISKPLIVTLRAGSPVRSTSGKVVAAVIINVDLEGFFNELKSIAAPGQLVFLINQRGEYIFHRDSSRIFASQLGHGYSFTTDYSASGINGFEKAKSGSLLSASGESFLFYNRRINYFSERYMVSLYTGISTKVVTESIREIRASSLRTLFIFCLISILFSLVFTSFLAGRINQITLAMGSIDAKERGEEDLSIHRKDEIGVLARTFARMRKTIKKQFEDLSEALREEKKAKRDRDEFLQNMSHEMRTPLNAITGLIQVLKRNNPRKAQYPIIQSLERSAQNLSGLVYDVLEHQKLSEGKLKIYPEPVFIDRIIRDIHAGYIYAALEKGLDFQLSISEELSDTKYMTDPTRLSQIVTNLVVNAIKYTEGGEVKLSVQHDYTKENTIEITVEDTGIGIHPDNLEKINERFYREDESRAGQYGGYGLGLSIVKQLVDLFGGEFHATSVKGEGSAFTVRIPVFPVKITRDASARRLMDYRPEIIETKKVLHLEDDPSNRELVKHLLDHRMIYLKQICSSQELSEINFVPDLIITDILLGDVRIEEILPAWTQKLKVEPPLLVSSALEPEVLAGLSDYVVQKPFEISHFLDLVYFLLTKNEFTEPVFDNLYQNYDYNPRMIDKALSVLLDEFLKFRSKIQQSLETKDQKSWEETLHKLISTVRQLELKDLDDALHENVNEIGKKGKILRIVDWYVLCLILEKRTQELTVGD